MRYNHYVDPSQIKSEGEEPPAVCGATDGGIFGCNQSATTCPKCQKWIRTKWARSPVATWKEVTWTYYHTWVQGRKLLHIDQDMSGGDVSLVNTFEDGCQSRITGQQHFRGSSETPAGGLDAPIVEVLERTHPPLWMQQEIKA